jgi:hypothetical protein
MGITSNLTDKFHTLLFAISVYAAFIWSQNFTIEY